MWAATRRRSTVPVTTRSAVWRRWLAGAAATGAGMRTCGFRAATEMIGEQIEKSCSLLGVEQRPNGYDVVSKPLVDGQVFLADRLELLTHGIFVELVGFDQDRQFRPLDA